MKSVLSDDSSPTGEHPTLDHTRPQPGAASFGTPNEVHRSQQDNPPANRSVFQSTATASPIASSSQVLPGSHDAPPEQVAQDRTVISLRPAAVPADFVRSLSLVELSRTLEGRQLHHFAVDRMIGGGGMGAVFRGRDLRLDREVAIKVIPESRRDPETLRRFRMEAQSAARLDHPNIARVYDIGEDETWNYIVFEFIDGINLRDLVQIEGPMSIDDAVFTTRQVAEALQHAHDRDVVHRDIKPSNVIITPNGIAKVVDMGLARNTAMDRSTADQTASGVTLGTFDYISPEQARDPRDADVRSDLYSLGCTLFYMLTGQPPFPDGTALQKLLNHGSQPHPDPRQWRDDISDQLAAVLSKLMAKRPTDRYQKPVELINDLMLIAQIESLPRSRTAGTILLRPTIAQRSLFEQHMPWLVPLCVLLGSVFWLQSADSLTSPLELPQPNLLPAQGLRSVPPVDLRSPAAANDIDALRPSREREQPKIESESVPPSATDNSLNPKSSSTSPSLSSTFSQAGSPAPGTAGVTLPVAPTTSEPSNGALVADFPGIERPEPFAPTPPAITGTRNQGQTSEVAFNNPSMGIGIAISKLLAPAPSASEPVKSANSDLPAGERTEPATAGNSTSSLVFAEDTILVRRDSENVAGGPRWAPTLSAAFAQAALSPEIRTIELHESVELTAAITVPRSGLTLRAAPGVPVHIVLSGAEAFGMGWETWIDIERKTLRCQGLRFTCLNDMRQPQAVFGLRTGGRLELEDCVVTMAGSRDAVLGACVLVKEWVRPSSLLTGEGRGSQSGPANGTAATATDIATDSMPMPATAMPTTSMPTAMPNAMPTTSMPAAMPPTLMPATSTPSPMPTIASSSATDTGAPARSSDETMQGGALDSDSEPVSISISRSIMRGAQSLISMRSVCRAEISIESVCAMLEGRALTIRATEDSRMPPVIRMNLQQSTLVCQQGFAAVQASGVSRVPLTLMRTAKLCAFWSPSSVPHIAIDGIDSQDVLDKLLLLRGEENAYDQNIETLCQCRFSDGQHIDYSLRDSMGEWFRELGNENILRWQGSVPPERAMEDQFPEDYRVRESMFMPGYREP